MQHTLSSSGLRAALAAVAATSALCGAPALAQASGEDAVAHCRSLLTDAARISCLEEALLGSQPTAQPATPATDAAAAAASTAATTTATATDDDVPARRGGLRMPGIPFIGGDETEDRVVSSDSPEADEFGAREVAARNNMPEVIPRLVADVVDAKVVPYKRLEVVLDNGQVWRQTGSDEPRWDGVRYDDPESVEIWASRTGGYRMRFIDDQNVTMAVVRVE